MVKKPNPSWELYKMLESLFSSLYGTFHISVKVYTIIQYLLGYTWGYPMKIKSFYTIIQRLPVLVTTGLKRLRVPCWNGHLKDNYCNFWQEMLMLGVLVRNALSKWFLWSPQCAFSFNICPKYSTRLHLIWVSRSVILQVLYKQFPSSLLVYSHLTVEIL